MHGIDLGRKAFDTNPETYGYHMSHNVYSEDLGLILEIGKEYVRILVNGVPSWIYKEHIMCNLLTKSDTL